MSAINTEMRNHIVEELKRNILNNIANFLNTYTDDWVCEEYTTPCYCKMSDEFVKNNPHLTDGYSEFEKLVYKGDNPIREAWLKAKEEEKLKAFNEVYNTLKEDVLESLEDFAESMQYNL